MMRRFATGRFATSWATRGLTMTGLALAGAALFGGCDAENVDWSAFAPDQKAILLEPGELSVIEGDAAMTYEIALGMVPDAAVRVELSSSLDVVRIEPATVVFATGDWAQPRTIRITVPDDARAEATVVDTLRHAVTTDDADYAAMAVPDLPITVLDNDSPGVIIAPSTIEVVETEDGSDTDTYEIRLATQPLAPVSIDVEPGDPGVAVSTGRLGFMPENWNVPQTVTVSALEDFVAEGSHIELIRHVLTSADPAYDGMEAPNVVVRITDTTVPLLALTVAEPLVREDHGPFVLNLSLNIPTVGTVLVLLEIEDGQALAGVDYEDRQELITIEPGEMSTSVEIAIIDDGEAEPVENFFARIVEPAVNAEIGMQNLVELGILDDERPSVTIADAQVDETAGDLVFRITVDPPASDALPINVATLQGTATEGEDYVGFTGIELVIPGGSEWVDLTVDVIDDDVADEPTEFFSVEISASPDLANVVDATATGTIVDPGETGPAR
jgi:hypothetical protein